MSKPGRETIPCFYLEPTDRVELILRRYRCTEHRCDKSRFGYCDIQASVEFTRIAALAARGWPMGKNGRPIYGDSQVPHDDPRWPAQCACGYHFQADDIWQCAPKVLYRRSDDAKLICIDAAGPGAMWWASWYSDHADYRGPDGRTLVVRLPGKGGGSHDWIVDSVASNCNSPCATCKVPRNKHGSQEKAGHRYVDAKPHKCWIRTGKPPNVTAGKHGVTCSAGGGSILTQDKWHGFLTAGKLVGRFE